ncbi:MAG TPA: hypothetical protein VK502_04405 [Candidatus Saccharimonadales bacterium]|nr:hypothetical protein [Candidatus Saccharimonadales bacterium]
MAVTSDDEKAKIVNINLTEMRRTFDHISNIYDQMRLKALGFIAGEIAIVTFLFSASVKFPDVLYGQIIFLTAVIMLCVAFGLLMWTISTVGWRIPCDFEGHKKTIRKYPSELALLECIHDDYIGAINDANTVVTKRARRFNWTIYLLSAGVIIILLVKYGGPQ